MISVFQNAEYAFGNRVEDEATPLIFNSHHLGAAVNGA